MYSTRVSATTVLSTKISSEQSNKFKEIRETQRKLGYISSQTLIQMIKDGNLNLPFSIKDIIMADKVIGPNIAIVKGKTRVNQPINYQQIPAEKHEEKELVLQIDIIFIEDQPYFISLAQPLDLISVDSIESSPKTFQTARKHILNHIDGLRSEGFVVKEILCDGEKSFSALRRELNSMGIKITTGGSKKNSIIPHLDKKISTLKSKVRCILNDLEYHLPIKLLKYCVMYAAITMNMIRTSPLTVLSPKELFIGKKLNYERDLKLAFGKFVQATIPNSDKSMQERTTSCLSLTPTFNNTGSYKFYSLKTGEIITRTNWKVVPLSDIVVSYINSLTIGTPLPSKDKVYLELNQDVNLPEDLQQGHHNPPIQVEQHQIEQINEQQVDNIINNNVEVENDMIQHDNNIPDDHVVEVEDETLDDEENIIENDIGNDAEHQLVSNSIEEEKEEEEVEEAEEELILENTLQETNVNLPSTVSEQPQIINTTSSTSNDQQIITATNPRRSSRSTKGNKYEDVLNAVKYKNFNLTITEAIHKHGNDAVESLKNEIKQMESLKVWEPVKEYDKAKVLPSKWFAKEKFNENNVLSKVKTRVVAGGHKQEDIYETYSPTLNIISLFTLCNVSIKENYKIATADVIGAYLNAPMSDEIYVKINQDIVPYIIEQNQQYKNYIQQNGTLILRLKKALYGCKQSGRLWYQKLKEILNELKFNELTADQCIFVKNFNNRKIIIGVYVDDLWIMYKDPNDLQNFHNDISRHVQGITLNMEDEQQYLGMVFNFSNKDEIKIGMKNYINEILKENNIVNTVTAPADQNSFKRLIM